MFFFGSPASSHVWWPGPHAMHDIIIVRDRWEKWEWVYNIYEEEKTIKSPHTQVSAQSGRNWFFYQFFPAFNFRFRWTCFFRGRGVCKSPATAESLRRGESWLIEWSEFWTYSTDSFRLSFSSLSRKSIVLRASDPMNHCQVKFMHRHGWADVTKWHFCWAKIENSFSTFVLMHLRDFRREFILNNKFKFYLLLLCFCASSNRIPICIRSTVILMKEKAQLNSISS